MSWVSKSHNCSSHILSHFLSVSKLYELRLWFQRCLEAKGLILYLRPFSIAIYGKPKSEFFLACKLYNSGLQIVSLISDYLRFFTSADIGGFY